MSSHSKRQANEIHRPLMERYPKAFPKNYNPIIPPKVGILADLTRRLPDADPGLLRRTLANHTARDGYLLALAHHRSDRRYDLDDRPVGTVNPEEHAEALKKLAASTEPGQAKAERARTHQAREEKRRLQREIERKNREAKAACKAALETQGIRVESRSERKRRLAREVVERA